MQMSTMDAMIWCLHDTVNAIVGRGSDVDRKLQE